MVRRRETNGGVWLVLGHEECVEIARKPEAFSNRERIVVEEILKRIPEFTFDETVGAEWVGGQVAGIEHVPVLLPRGTARADAEGGQRGAVDVWLPHARVQ